MSRSVQFVLASLFCLVPALVAQTPAGTGPAVTGTLTYRERVALPPTAAAEVTLEDVSRPDAPPSIVARVRIAPAGQVPLTFELPFDPARIDPGKRYALRARITDGETVLFALMQTKLVLTQGRDSRADLLLTRVAAPRPQTPAPKPAAAVAAPATPASQGATAPLPPVAPLPPAARLANLPATFSGTATAQDGAALRYQLNLFDDDSYVLRMTSTGRGAATLDEIGSWTLSSDRRIVIIRGSRETTEYFSIRDAQTLRKIELDVSDGKPAPATDLRRGATFLPIEVRATLRGSYRFTPDSSLFTECLSGQRWPVSREAASRELEMTYLEAKKRAGQPLLVAVEGRVAARPRMDQPGTEPTLVVDRVLRATPSETCAPRFAGTPLEGVDWRLVRIGDVLVPASSDRKNEPYLAFQASAPRFSGTSGCNRLVGTFEKGTDTLTLTAAGTMKACAKGMDVESAFVAALRQVQTWRVLGNILELQDGQRKLLARFEARPRK